MKKVLIAEDDPVMVKLLELSLKKGGFDVIICREGLCVQTRTLQESPDLVIFDLLLPGKSGLELIQSFKEHPTLSHLPIIVVTGQGKECTKDELLAAGANQVYTKPFSPKKLTSAINELLETREETPTT